ncbi:putative quinol monooxygenase [Actinoplanes couchii]|uniref:Antibiotic biosynthesis monooxygenase n=1 Tax=Actinoplanes couchii TaxID=403638 RepID=A0ABQ3XKJ1_9ACTN|nr:antibiotic biosynthesis monooxygenase family protein [Actinoplanes couchii]MDR6319587.1 quinol monooxygenase YgiN [Actinoplanes couchii]GID59022.1 antibiotic biosynthesis monooxygenase [Actinoplanes couchii]
MIIIAGQLHVAPGDRKRYLAATADVARLAREAAGCHDFVQAADPLDAGRINIYERWESDEDLARFRGEEGERSDGDLPPLQGADVRKYRISGVEDA